MILQRIEEMKTIFDRDELKEKIDHCRKEINQLHHKLMALDMMLDNQLEVCVCVCDVM